VEGPLVGALGAEDLQEAVDVVDGGRGQEHDSPLSCGSRW
jgi:hypothetical protein